MDTTVVELISQLGFPIGVCLICFWYINKIQTQYKEDLDKLSQAVNNNTTVMAKILTKLGETEDMD